MCAQMLGYGLGQPDRSSRSSVGLWTEARHRSSVLRVVTSPSGPAEDLWNFRARPRRMGCGGMPGWS